MPLAHERRRVSGFLEPLGDRDVLQRQMIERLGGQQLRILGREVSIGDVRGHAQSSR